MIYNIPSTANLPLVFGSNKGEGSTAVDIGVAVYRSPQIQYKFLVTRLPKYSDGSKNIIIVTS